MAGNKLSKPTYLLLELDPLARRWLASFVNMVSRGYLGVITGGLTRYIGLKGLMLAATPSTADTPRAHITNMAALECLRDIGLEEECIRVAVKGDCMQHTRWCRSMAGEEFARIYSWGNDPSRAVRNLYGSILCGPDHNRETTTLPAPAAMSIFRKQPLSQFLCVMRPTTAFNVGLIHLLSLTTASQMGLSSVKSLMAYLSRLIRYGPSISLVATEPEVKCCGN